LRKTGDLIDKPSEGFRMKRLIFFYASIFAAGMTQLCAQMSFNVTLEGQLNNHHASGGTVNNYYSEIWGWTDTVSHREYAIIGAYDGTSIVDITDTLKEKGFIVGPHNSYNYHEFRTYLNYLYVGAEGNDTARNAGVQIVDLSPLPNAPVLKKNLVWLDTIKGVAFKYYAAHTLNAEGKYLYVNGGGGDGASIHGFGGIRIYDLSDPLNPKQAGSYGKESTPYVHDSYTRNDTIYAACINIGTLNILDARKKDSIKIVGNPIPTVPEARTHNVWTTADGKYALTASEIVGGHLHIYDVHDPTSPFEIASWTSNPATSIHNVIVNGDFAYIAYYSDGFRIVDIKNPANPIEVGFYDTHPGPILTTFEGAWGVYPFFPSGKIAVSDMNTGLYIFTFNKKHGGQIAGIVRSAANNQALDSVQITVLESGRAESTKSTGQYKYGTAEGITAVRYTRRGFLQRIDTVNIRAGKIDTVNVVLTPGVTVEVRKEQREAPRTFSLEQNYPNPFNPVTHFQFTVPEARQPSAEISDLPPEADAPLAQRLVSLKIYDLLGREVNTIVNKMMEPGTYSVTWDASGASSGVYYYRLSEGEFSETKKLIIAK
jgi:choice-of-anchor B domain-containing protein